MRARESDYLNLKFSRVKKKKKRVAKNSLKIMIKDTQRCALKFYLCRLCLEQ